MVAIANERCSAIASLERLFRHRATVFITVFGGLSSGALDFRFRRDRVARSGMLPANSHVAQPAAMASSTASPKRLTFMSPKPVMPKSSSFVWGRKAASSRRLLSGKTT